MGLTPEQEAQLLALMSYEIESLESFILRVSPHHPPQPHMQELIRLFEKTRTAEIRATVSMPPRHAKLLGDSTPVYTPSGPTTHGELEVGSVIYAPDGTPTTVTYISPRGLATHEITLSDGESFTANLGHRWPVYVRGAGYRTLETKDILPGYYIKHWAQDTPARLITSIKPCAPEPGHCITVDHPSHCYLVGHTLVPTHNTTTMMHGLAWRLANDPRLSHAFVSFGADLARNKSRFIRNLVLDSGCQLDSMSKAVDEWYTVKRGALYATGVGGPLTGKGITGVAVVDDPIKNREEADSPTTRDKVWDWFNDVLYTRLEPGSSCIVVATRWHPDDLIGRLHSTDYSHGAWEQINIPAVSDEEGNPADERLVEPVHALWPEQYGLDRLIDIRRQLGEYGWSSLYQGQPTPKGASVFSNPARYQESDSLEGARYVIGVDPAATASTKADYSVAVVMSAVGYQERMRCRVHDVLRIQVTIPELCRQLGALQAKWKVPMAVEAVGAFKAIPQILKETDPSLRLLPVTLKGDKFARAQPYAAAWNDGRVELPLTGSWVNAYLDEHLSFTGVRDKNDDQVDAATHAYMALYNSRPPRKTYRDLDFLPLG